MKLTWHVYEVDRRSQSQPNTVVSSQMWHTARPWQVGVASLWPSTVYKACQTPFICMKWTWHVYEVDWRSQSQLNTVVSSQMWHKARPWPWPYRLGLHPYDHPLCMKYAKHLLYVWSGPEMCMTWIGGSNHSLVIVWLVPRCDTQPGPGHGHTGWGCILMTIHCI